MGFQKFEILFYALVWISAVFYAIFCFAHQSSKYFHSYSDEYDDFQGGYFGKQKDISDLEWKTVVYLYHEIWIWIIAKLFMSELIKTAGFEVLEIFEIGVSVGFILIYLGPICVFSIIAQPIIFRLVYCISKKKYVLWITNILIIFLISFYKHKVSNEYFMASLKFNQEENYLHILAIYWTNLRTFSFFMEQKADIEFSNINLFSYCLYLPMLFNGPFIFYSDYRKKSNSALKQRFINLVKDTIRFTFWFVFVEFSLHFIYINATSFQLQLVESFDPWALYGYGYLMGQYFHLKYLVIYGMSTTVAKFDNIPVPSLPKCIGRIHMYSDMWKYFDNGLYKFLLRYIYIPTVDISSGNKILGSLFCFIFVYLWHGLDVYILIWVVLNFIGIIIENVAGNFYKIYIEDLKIIEHLGTNSIRRIACFLASFLLAMSAISNFYFFAGLNIGTTFFTRLSEDSFKNNAILIFVLYCCCQISTELRVAKEKIKKDL